jgi:hypothetical protein
MSAYVLARALPDARLKFARLLAALRDEDRPSFALTELNDLLSDLTVAVVELIGGASLSPRSGLGNLAAEFPSLGQRSFS